MFVYFAFFLGFVFVIFSVRSCFGDKETRKKRYYQSFYPAIVAMIGFGLLISFYPNRVFQDVRQCKYSGKNTEFHNIGSDVSIPNGETGICGYLENLSVSQKILFGDSIPVSVRVYTTNGYISLEVDDEDQITTLTGGEFFIPVPELDDNNWLFIEGISSHKVLFRLENK